MVSVFGFFLAFQVGWLCTGITATVETAIGLGWQLFIYLGSLMLVWSRCHVLSQWDFGIALQVRNSTLLIEESIFTGSLYVYCVNHP